VTPDAGSPGAQLPHRQPHIMPLGWNRQVDSLRSPVKTRTGDRDRQIGIGVTGAPVEGNSLPDGQATLRRRSGSFSIRLANVKCSVNDVKLFWFP
jgi:hypothetical protein